MTSQSPNPGEAVPSQQPGHAWTVRRRWIAAALLVLLGALTAYSELTPHLHVCGDVIAQTGFEPTARTCDPIGLTDPPVILALILIVGLISPDFSRIKLGGFIELERRLTEQTAAVRSLEEKIVNLTVSMSRSASNAESSTNFNLTLPPDTDFADLLETLNKKAERLADRVDDSGK